MRKFITIITIVGMALVQPLGGATADAATRSDHESSFAELMNRERAARGLSRLSVSGDLVDYGRRHSAEMASQDDLHHSSDLRTLSNWKLLGENVGRGGSVQALHDAFMNSPSHRDNVLRGEFSQVGVGVVVSGSTIWVTVVFRQPEKTTSTGSSGSPSRTSATDLPPDAHVVVAAMADPNGKGIWKVFRDGTVEALGGAPFYGDVSGTNHSGIVDAVADPAGRGYWLISDRGGVYTFGDGLPFYGSAASLHIVGDIENAVPHPSGRGYWLLTDRGGVYTFGNIPFFGAATDISPEPFVDAVADPAGRGNWLITASGSVFGFGSVPRY